MLVMVAGLLLALAASNLIHLRDRDRFARQMNIDHYVERVSAAVRVLDQERGARRADILKVMQTPLFRVQPVDALPAPEDIRFTDSPQSRPVEARLKERLGREAVIFRIAPLPRRGDWPPAGDHGQRRLRPAPSGFVTFVGLVDGSVIRLTSRAPGSTTSWPARLLMTLAVVLLASLLLAALAVRFVVRPLRSVAAQAEQIGRDLQTPAMSETGPTEVRQVARAMNSMQEKIRQLFEQRSRFLAAVSHDLRTPITRLRLRAELVDDESLRVRMTRDLDEMGRMVQETLEFIRDESSREPMRKVDLNALLEALVEDVSEQVEDVAYEPIERTVVRCRPPALRRALGNLLVNAARHGDHVTLRARIDGGSVVVEVIDDGPGIPEGELERVFEPFYRLDKARGDGGAGLGLSIARAVAESHGGTLTLANRGGGGICARFEWPGGMPD
ncbi:MAG: HAMP domain-containing protein [Proteobacteria bacterium]|nr:MAG: HAMP domain-containing protein [Pseudomonadota bacterium]